MARKIIQLINDEIYHIIARGVDGRLIFQDDEDYYRGVHNLYEFNDEDLASWIYRRSFTKEGNEAKKIEEKKSRKLLVHVLAFVFMPNHIHFLLRQVKEKGISKFMQKFGTGYAVYFNHKNNRRGALFQGRFKVVHISDNEQLKTNFVYVHTNPVAIVEPNWKLNGIKDLRRAIKTIENYKWSSYQDYLGHKNFPSVTQRGLLEKILNLEEWRQCINNWLKHKKEDF